MTDRLVPQAWIDRAMQIETAADALVSEVNDAMQRAQEGTGRLYAANIVQLDERATAVLEAINLPEPSFGNASALAETGPANHDPMKHGMHAKTEVDRIAILLFEAFAKAEPRHGITLHPTSYWATFADMARAVIADAASPAPSASAETVPAKRCSAGPDHADIMETIENAADDWQAKGYTSALAEVRDMANVGRALMEALPAGYSYCDCPSEIVSDLMNERDEALAKPTPAAPAQSEVEGAEYMSVTIDRDGHVTAHNAYDANFDEMVDATRKIIAALQERLARRLKCPFAAGKELRTTTAPAQSEVEAALAWYGEQARLARLIHSEGDAGRHALAADGGKRAREALSSTGAGEKEQRDG